MEEKRRYIHSAHERMHGVLAKAIEDLDECQREIAVDYDGNVPDEHANAEARFALSWYDNILVRFCEGREWEVDALDLRNEIDALGKRLGTPADGLEGEIAQLRGRLLGLEAVVAEIRDVFTRISALAGKE